MNFIKIVEEALEDEVQKHSAMLGSISTNSGLYTTAKTGSSAGNLATKFGPTSVGATSFTSFSTNSTNSNQFSDNGTTELLDTGRDITDSKKRKKKKSPYGSRSLAIS